MPWGYLKWSAFLRIFWLCSEHISPWVRLLFDFGTPWGGGPAEGRHKRPFLRLFVIYPQKNFRLRRAHNPFWDPPGGLYDWILRRTSICSGLENWGLLFWPTHSLTHSRTLFSLHWLLPQGSPYGIPWKVHWGARFYGNNSSSEKLFWVWGSTPWGAGSLLTPRCRRPPTQRKLFCLGGAVRGICFRENEII